MQTSHLGVANQVEQIPGLVGIHHESDGAPIHAVDGLPLVHEAMDRLEHEAVPAEGDDHVRVCGGFRWIARFEDLESGLSRLRIGGHERDVLRIGIGPRALRVCTRGRGGRLVSIAASGHSGSSGWWRD